MKCFVTGARLEKPELDAGWRMNRFGMGRGGMGEATMRINGFLNKGLFMAALALAIPSAIAQQAQNVDKRISDNYSALRQYSWTMRTAVEVQGQQISATVEKMRYDLDGKLQVTPLGGSGNLTPEMQKLADALARLAFSYAQPDPQKFQAFYNKTTQWEGQGKNAGTLRIEGEGFLQGDDVIEIIARNGRVDKSMIRTALQGTPVNIEAEYLALPKDGPRYVARLSAAVPSERVDLTIETFDYILNAPVAAGDVSILPEGTELQVRLLQPLSSAKNQTGQTFEVTLDKDIVLRGKTVLAKGSRLQGQILNAEGSGKVSGRAKMSITLKQLQAAGKTLNLVTNTFAFEAEGTGGRDVARVAGGSGIGALVGAIAGGGKGAAIGAAIGGGVGVVATMLTKGKEVEFGAETLFSFQLAKPLEISR